MGLAAFITVGIGKTTGGSHACCLADKSFKDHPQFGAGKRTHEGLVVKPCWNEAGDQLIDRLGVVFQVRPAILAVGDQAVIQFRHGGAGIGFLAGPFPHSDQRIGFFCPGREYPAGAVIFETARDQFDIICHQRRGKRVPFKPGIGFTIETEFNRFGSVDVPEATQPVGLVAHLSAPPFPVGSSLIGPVAAP